MLGIANIIPGISGGTMAVSLNIYDRLMHSLSKKGFRENLGFLLTLALGAATGIFALSSLISYLLLHYPEATNYFFIGIVLGSIPMVAQKTRINPRHITWKSAATFAVFFGMMIAMELFTPPDAAKQEVLFALSAGECFFYGFLGMICAIAMIVPGISGSFLLLILGGYGTVTAAISRLNLGILLPFGLGVVAGLIIGVKVMRYLLSKYQQQTYVAILGLMMGSLYQMYFPIEMDGMGIFSIGMLLLSTVVTYFLLRPIQKNKTEKKDALE